jgi:hypothetical protein
MAAIIIFMEKEINYNRIRLIIAIFMRKEIMGIVAEVQLRKGKESQYCDFI